MITVQWCTQSFTCAAQQLPVEKLHARAGLLTCGNMKGERTLTILAHTRLREEGLTISVTSVARVQPEMVDSGSKLGVQLLRALLGCLSRLLGGSGTLALHRRRCMQLLLRLLGCLKRRLRRFAPLLKGSGE